MALLKRARERGGFLLIPRFVQMNGPWMRLLSEEGNLWGASGTAYFKSFLLGLQLGNSNFSFRPNFTRKATPKHEQILTSF